MKSLQKVRWKLLILMECTQAVITTQKQGLHTIGIDVVGGDLGSVIFKTTKDGGKTWLKTNYAY